MTSSSLIIDNLLLLSRAQATSLQKIRIIRNCWHIVEDNCGKSCTAWHAQPFKSQYPHTNSPNWSPYISLKNYLREFGKRSNIFLFVIILLILIDFAHDSLWISLGENWSWALLGLKGLNATRIPLMQYWSTNRLSIYGLMLKTLLASNLLFNHFNLRSIRVTVQLL